MVIHTVPYERATIHGAFNAMTPPVLTIAPGDTVRYQTMDAGWSWESPLADGTPTNKVSDRDPQRDSGHALSGPVAIAGAEPGMTLSVRLDTLRVGLWGFTVAGGWNSPVNNRLHVGEGTEKCYLLWELDAERGVGRSATGFEVGLRPFLGVIGMPPAEPGWHSTTPPRLTGGNIDCAELVQGSTLFLPIQVPNGLVSVGDGHARQGDGESSGLAIECPMDLVEITYDLLPDQMLPGPWAETPAGTITFGFDEDLDIAMTNALDAMLTLLGHRYGVSRTEALALASVVVDLRVTQVVNRVQGVHAILPPDALRRVGAEPVVST